MISIVIPSYGRPERLGACLAALAEQDGGPYETIVVDDGSPQPLAPVCAQFGEWVKPLRQANAGPAAARNAGVDAASGDFICFTDDDCLPHSGWVSSLLEAQGGDPEKLVGGRVVNALRDNLYSETSQSISDYLYRAQPPKNGGAFFTTNNMGCSRAKFLELGKFDESFRLPAGEDREFGERWGERIGPLIYAPDAIVQHFHELNLTGFWKQQTNYGRGARHLRRLNTQKRQDRVADMSGREDNFGKPSFYAGLLLHPLARRELGLSRRIALTALACLSQIAITRGYFSEKRRERPAAR